MHHLSLCAFQKGQSSQVKFDQVKSEYLELGRGVFWELGVGKQGCDMIDDLGMPHACKGLLPCIT